MSKEQNTEKKPKLAICTADREKLVKKFQTVNDTVYRNFKRDTWKLAHTALSIRNDKSYDTAFRSDKDFASAVGYTAGALSKLITSAMIDTEYKVSETYNLTTGQTQELIPLYRLTREQEGNETEDFLKNFLDRHDAEGDLASASTKLVREYVQDELHLLTGMEDKEAKTVTVDETDDETDVNGESENVTADEVPMSAAEVLDAIIGIINKARAEDVFNGDVAHDAEIKNDVLDAIVDLLESEDLI